MDHDNFKRIGLSVFVVVLLLIGVLVGTLVTRNLSTSQNTKTSASQSTVTPLEVLSPPPGDTLTKVTEVKARLTSSVDPKKLTAVYKLGDNSAVPMKIEQLADKVVLTGTLDPAVFPKGRQTLSIYLYQNESSSADLIGSSVFYVQI